MKVVFLVASSFLIICTLPPPSVGLKCYHCIHCKGFNKKTAAIIECVGYKRPMCSSFSKFHGPSGCFEQPKRNRGRRHKPDNYAPDASKCKQIGQPLLKYNWCGCKTDLCNDTDSLISSSRHARFIVICQVVLMFYANQIQAQ